MLAALVVLPAAEQVRARTLYLAPDGDDSASCAHGAEFATLARAMDCLGPGDTLIIRDGVYRGGLIATVEGTEEQPILIRGESLGAVIDSSLNGLDALRLDHSSHVTLDRLTFRNADRAGIGIINCDHITVTGCLCRDNRNWGIFTGFADDVRFERNECCGSRREHGIYHSNSGDRFIIRDNILHHNAANGIHLNGDPEMGGDGVLSYGLVERNIIYGNGQMGGAGINMTHVQDVLVRNNLIHDNYAGGFTVYQDTGTFEQGSKRVVIAGNTVYFRENRGRSGVNIGETTEKVVVAGNILVTGGYGEQVPLLVYSEHTESIISDRNILAGVDTSGMVSLRGSIISLAEWRSRTGNDRTSLAADPGFVAIDSADFRLAQGSPAIDAGMRRDSLLARLESLGGCDWLIALVDSLPAEDLRTFKRPVGAAPDAGAYETGASPQSLYDFNRDGRLDIIDAVCLAVRIHRGGAYEPRNDVDGDGEAGKGDVIALLRILRSLNSHETMPAFSLPGT